MRVLSRVENDALVDISPSFTLVARQNLSALGFEWAGSLGKRKSSISWPISKCRLMLAPSGRSLLSSEVVMDWLNSYHYHQDDSKRARVQIDLGPFAAQQDGLSFVLLALTDMVQSILATSTFIETLMLCAEGKVPTISCPPHYFHQRPNGD